MPSSAGPQRSPARGAEEPLLSDEWNGGAFAAHSGDEDEPQRTAGRESFISLAGPLLGDEDADAVAASREALRMAAWLGALLLCYAHTRLWVRLAGLPSDGMRALEAADAADDAARLLTYGAVLGWLVGVTRPHRAAWLWHPRQWWLWVLLAGTPPVYGALGELPGLQHSLADVAAWGPVAWAVLPGGLAAGAACAAWHVVHAFREAPTAADAAVFALSRAGAIAFYAASYVVFHKERRDTPGSAFHLHHLYIGWLLAQWGAFNRWPSGALLAIATGIFVQGIAAYEFADLFCDARCSHRLPPLARCVSGVA